MDHKRPGHRESTYGCQEQYGCGLKGRQRQDPLVAKIQSVDPHQEKCWESWVRKFVYELVLAEHTCRHSVEK
jgi:hypothetical protein